MYQSETCGGAIRGALVCLNSTITIVGLVIVGFLIPFSYFTATDHVSGVLAGLWNELRVGWSAMEVRYRLFRKKKKKPADNVHVRFPIGFQAVFALCLLLQVTVLPDSPRWLLAHGHVEEASKVIALLEDRDSIDHPDVVRAKKEIEQSLALESEGGKLYFSSTRSQLHNQVFRTLSLQ